jgi:HK97 family phage major capsid protein
VPAPDPAPAPAPDPAPAPSPESPSGPSASHERARPVARPGVGAGAFDRFDSFASYARAAWRGELDTATVASYRRALATVPSRHQRALADVVTGDMGSVVRDSWVTEILDLVRVLTPTVNAFSQRPLPPSGMSVYQPTIVTRPTVGEQVTQKTEITSTAIEFGDTSWPVKTYAGGSDVALQLIERADIGILDEFLRLYAEQMARSLNTAAATLVVAGADDVNPAVELVGEDFNAALIAAAKPMLTALGRLPTVALLSVDMWEFLGNILDADGRPVYPTVNPMNPVGSFSVTDPNGNVRGLTYAVEPAFTGKRAVVGVPEAFVTRKSGVRTLTADVPSLIGKDVAVYEYAAMGVTDAAGLSMIVDAV